MSRRAITVGYPHQGETPVVITGPEVPYPLHRQAMRDHKARGEHPEFQRVELWTSDAGVITKKKLAKPDAKAPAPKPAAPKGPDPKDKGPKSSGVQITRL
ncbi:MAG: hypothetical protein P4L99_28065 [Chthoniobacter sp.]|nr:hypothetical protein [Chthoniobacter sp.]